MKVSVKVNIPTEKILAKRGLGKSNQARRFIASEVKRLSDQYVPMQSGYLKNNARIASDGSSLTYQGPYAHYHWIGELMVGSAPKHYTGRGMDYHGEPMRGKQWTVRMLADRSHDLTASVSKKVGGKPK